MNEEQLKLKLFEKLEKINAEIVDNTKKKNYDHAYYCVGFGKALKQVLVWLNCNDLIESYEIDEYDDFEKIK